MPAYVTEAIEAGLVSPPPGEENLNLRYSFRILVPIILLVSDLALSLQSDLITDMSIALLSIL